MTHKAIANVLRAILLAIALLACTTTVVWVYTPSLINKLEATIIKHYTRGSRKHLAAATEQLSQDTTQGIASLESLLSDLDDIKKGDRLAYIKTKAFLFIVRSLSQQEDFTKALYWATRWSEFDARDLNAQIWRAKMLLHLPEGREKGAQAITDLYHRIPEVVIVSNAYIDLLRSQDQSIKALWVFIDYDRRRTIRHRSITSNMPDWELFWDQGSGFHASRRMVVTPSFIGKNRILISIELPAGIRFLRLDLPRMEGLAIYRPEMEASVGDKKTRLQLWREHLQLHQMQQLGETLLTTADQDPYFFWTIPLAWREHALSVRLSMELPKFTPPWVQQILTASQPDAIKLTLRQLGGDETVEYFEKLRSVSLGSTDDKTR